MRISISHRLHRLHRWKFLSVSSVLSVALSFLIAAVPSQRRAASPAVAAGGGTTLFLDETGLGSAAAAYSPRKLRAAYAGSALRVRRSSDSTEQDIGFSGNNLDTAAMESFCGAGDGFVVKWYDQSGNARDVTQSTAGSQPKIVSSGVTLTDGGIPYFLTDDVDDDMTAASWSQATPITVYLSVHMPAGNAQYDCVFDGTAVNTYRVLRGANDTETYAWNAITGGNAAAVRTTHTITNPGTGGGNLTHRRNGLTETTGAGATMTPGGIYIGRNPSGGSPVACRYFELVVYGATHDATTQTTARDNIDAWLAWN